jgi:hypothetical protein
MDKTSFHNTDPRHPELAGDESGSTDPYRHLTGPPRIHFPRSAESLEARALYPHVYEPFSFSLQQSGRWMFAPVKQLMILTYVLQVWAL